MRFITEDPTYLATGLGVAAVVFLVMMKVTQQGKYLLYAGSCSACWRCCWRASGCG